MSDALGAACIVYLSVSTIGVTPILMEKDSGAAIAWFFLWPWILARIAVKGLKEFE